MTDDDIVRARLRTVGTFVSPSGPKRFLTISFSFLGIQEYKVTFRNTLDIPGEFLLPAGHFDDAILPRHPRRGGWFMGMANFRRRRMSNSCKDDNVLLQINIEPEKLSFSVPLGSLSSRTPTP